MMQKINFCEKKINSFVLYTPENEGDCVDAVPFREEVIMANRRMISSLVMESDAFLELPLSSQALYTHLILQADSWGFLSSLNNTKRMIGATQEDVDCLEENGFIIRFKGTPTVCITHWNMMNSLKDRGKSEFPEKKLVRQDGGVYVLRSAKDILDDDDDEED